jgi:cobyrinic acid a,c-diamide synthase
MDFQLEKKPQGHGYTKLEVVENNPFYPVGITFKGHEFHYSRVIDSDLDSNSLVFAMRRGTGILDGKDGVCYKNVLATYTHVHAIGTPEWAEALIRKALAHQRESKNNSERKKETWTTGKPTQGLVTGSDNKIRR